MRGGVLRRLVVLGLSLVVYVFDQSCRLFLPLIGRRPRGTGVALIYHAVPAEQRGRFARQMDLLRSIAVPIRADSRAPLAPARHHVAVTFDDGLTSFADNALPELERRDIPAAVFVVADRLGTIPAWISYTPGRLPTERMLTADQLRGFSDNVLVGSHGLTHRLLTDLDPSGARCEIESSRHRLQTVLGRPVELFSFPYGECSEDLIADCRAAGYDRVFTNLSSLAFSDPKEYVTGRVDVKLTDWPLEFRLKVVGAYRWLPSVIAVKHALFGG